MNDDGTINVRNSHTGASFSIRPRIRPDRFGDVFIGPPIKCRPTDVAQNINVGTVMKWMRRAKSGDRMVYHFGTLGLDRGIRSGSGAQLTVEAAQIKAVAKTMMKASDEGLVCLVQVRSQPLHKDALCSDFYYIAVRTDQAYKDFKHEQQGQPDDAGHELAAADPIALAA